MTRSLRARVRRAARGVASRAGHPGVRYLSALAEIPDSVADPAEAALTTLAKLDGGDTKRARARDRANARAWPALMRFIESLPVNVPESASDPDWLAVHLPIPGPAALAEARRVLDAATPAGEPERLAHEVMAFWAALTVGLAAPEAR